MKYHLTLRYPDGMSGEWLTPDEQRAWRTYLRMSALLPARLNRQLQRDSGLSLPEYEVLVALSEAPGGRLRPYQLCEALSWEQSRLSHQLTRMERRGLVAREECPADGRGAFVILQPEGGDAIESAAPGHVATVRQLIFDQFDDDQRAAFEKACAAILDSLSDESR
jgi:DNA-binding MarR family transcriptional regulator